MAKNLPDLVTLVKYKLAKITTISEDKNHLLALLFNHFCYKMFICMYINACTLMYVH
jgi:hypothetical protein